MLHRRKTDLKKHCHIHQRNCNNHSTILHPVACSNSGAEPSPRAARANILCPAASASPRSLPASSVPRARRDPRRPQAPSPRRSRRRRRHPLHWATRDHRPLRGHLGGKLWWHVTKIDQISSGCGCMRNQEKHEKSNWCWSMNQNESIWIYTKVPGVATSSDQPRYQHIPTTNPSVWFRRILLHWCVYIQGCAAIIIGGWLLLVGGWSNPESTQLPVNRA